MVYNRDMATETEEVRNETCEYCHSDSDRVATVWVEMYTVFRAFDCADCGEHNELTMDLEDSRYDG